ncbi:hypothetical protein FB451DRAFT_1379455 [Mycena latifolia]|nr:hypothetical protein FB451DRAFT_1379455 [Mycena latifolia]
MARARPTPALRLRVHERQGGHAECDEKARHEAPNTYDSTGTASTRFRRGAADALHAIKLEAQQTPHDSQGACRGTRWRGRGEEKRTKEVEGEKKRKRRREEEEGRDGRGMQRAPLVVMIGTCTPSASRESSAYIAKKADTSTAERIYRPLRAYIHRRRIHPPRWGTKRARRRRKKKGELSAGGRSRMEVARVKDVGAKKKVQEEARREVEGGRRKAKGELSNPRTSLPPGQPDASPTEDVARELLTRLASPERNSRLDGVDAAPARRSTASGGLPVPITVPIPTVASVPSFSDAQASRRVGLRRRLRAQADAGNRGRDGGRGAVGRLCRASVRVECGGRFGGGWWWSGAEADKSGRRGGVRAGCRGQGWDLARTLCPAWLRERKYEEKGSTTEGVKGRGGREGRGVKYLRIAKGIQRTGHASYWGEEIRLSGDAVAPTQRGTWRARHKPAYSGCALGGNASRGFSGEGAGGITYETKVELGYFGSVCVYEPSSMYLSRVHAKSRLKSGRTLACRIVYMTGACVPDTFYVCLLVLANSYTLDEGMHPCLGREPMKLVQCRVIKSLWCYLRAVLFGHLGQRQSALVEWYAV